MIVVSKKSYFYSLFLLPFLTTSLAIYMKTLLLLCLISTFTMSSLLLFSQEKCKVLNPNISGTYEGKCKNGFANGKGIAVGVDRYEGQFSKGLADGTGIYTWKTGETYSGEWMAGQRHGVGTYTMHVSGRDSVQSGLWLTDKYMGPKPKDPLVTYKLSVDRYNFKKANSSLERVLVDIYQNGSRNNKISDFRMNSSSGQNSSSGLSIGYNNVVFPVSVHISYTTTSKLNSTAVLVEFNFEIYEPGDWRVSIYN